MTTRLLRAPLLLTPEPLPDAWVALEDGRVLEVGTGRRPGAAALGPILCPGLVDLHGHGGGGASYSEGVDAARTAVRTHQLAGTTSVMASLVTDTVEALERQLRTLRPSVEAGDLLGVHLEGPWLAPEHCGAHDPALLTAPTPETVDRLLSAGGDALSMVTLAPELPGALAATARLAEAGVLVGIGHTAATHEQTCAAVAAGARVATHLHNAMRAGHHRDPGPATALLDDPRVTVELIADGVHLHPAVLAHAARTSDVALITDSMAAAGLGDGEFTLGPLRVTVSDAVARLSTEGGAGPIAGSTLTLAAAVRYAVQQAGLPLEHAVTAATRAPADLLGRADIGRIEAGARADLVSLDDDLQVSAVLRAGSRLR